MSFGEVMSNCDCCNNSVRAPVTPFQLYEDVTDPVDVLEAIITFNPDISPTRARSTLFTLLYWIRRGAWFNGDDLTYYQLSDIPLIVDSLVPAPIPEGQLSLL